MRISTYGISHLGVMVVTCEHGAAACDHGAGDGAERCCSPALLQGIASAADVDAELPYLRALARRLTLSPEDAHDLVQDAVVRALPALGKVRAGSHLRAWLITILRRIHIDGVRRSARAPQAIPIDEVNGGQLAIDDELTEPADDLTDDLDQALTALPEAFRRVLVLHELEGCSYREISASLDIPLATVGTRLSRARLKLRSLLAAKRARPA